MTTPIHNCDQTWYQYSLESWIRNGLLNEVEVRELCVASNTRQCPSALFRPSMANQVKVFTIPTGPYMGRAKAPNIAIRQRNARLPSVVFESGWSESITQLHNDMREWITWGNGLVKVVVILNWTRIGNNRVRGLAEVWFRNNSGNGQLLERHVSSHRCMVAVSILSTDNVTSKSSQSLGMATPR